MRSGTVAIAFALLACGHGSAENPAYRNAALPVETRVRDLLSRMTLDEKVAQLQDVLGWEMYAKDGKSAGASDKFRQTMKERPVGALYGLFRADPWSKVTLETGLSPRQSAEAANSIQRYAIENSRLGVPLLFSEECVHGHMAIGATVYPTSIGQASTWNPALIERVARATSAETRAAGGNVCYGPILDVSREPRWSRVEETYGEDPVLISRMGEAVVRGFQSAGLKSPDATLATLKHFAGYGQPEGGHNGAPTHAGPRELRDVLLPAFRAAVQAGAGSVMTAYNDIDGVPSVTNEWLLNDVLRKEWGFRGFVVSDLGGIEAIAGNSRIARDKAGAAVLAVRAGVDQDLGGGAYTDLVEAVKSGRVSGEVIDRAVSRVLQAKFELGLFENPYADPARAERVIGSAEHRELARQVARESVVLLRNERNVLPLAKDLGSIAVVGPNADSVYNQLGDYTAPQPAGKVVTVLEGIRRKLGTKTAVRYAKGCAIRGTSTSGFAEALAAVRQSDVAVVVLGGSSARDFNTLFASTGAASPSLDASGSDMEAGEGFDRATLGLAGVQLDLLREIVATGKPVVLVLIKGRPLTLDWPVEHVPAILDSWYPGEEGGNAIADVLFGDYNPAGRLPISVPRSAGQLPVFYNALGRARANYIEMDGAPLFGFGYGLSYTRFAYTNLQVAAREQQAGVTVSVAVDIANTGGRDGDEVVQVYARPLTASVSTPVLALKAFERVHLAAAEKRTVRFTLTGADLALYDQQMRHVVEAGEFEVLVGGASTDLGQRARFTVRTGFPIHDAPGL